MEAALERKARLAEATSRLQRVLDPVRAVIAVSAAAGALVTALRPVPGGGLGEPLPANCWNTDDQRIATRFDLCRMSRENPFDNRAEGHGFIFIGSKGLQTVLDALTPVDLPVYELSPDAQGAITAAKIEDLKEQLKRTLVSRSTSRIVTAKPVTHVRGGRPSSIPIGRIANGPAAAHPPATTTEPVVDDAPPDTVHQLTPPPLKKTTKPDVVHSKLVIVYESAKKQGVKPPNVNEVAAYVNALLGKEGRRAAADLIRKLAGDARYEIFKLKPGAHATALRPLSDLSLP